MIGACPSRLDLAERIAYELGRAGWELGVSGFLRRGGRATWIVFGTRGARTLHAEGGTPAEAWIRAARQAIEPR